MTTASGKKNSLEYVRRERKLSKASVAAELNTSAGRVSSFESGEKLPSPRQYKILEGIYGVPDYLLAGESTPNLEPLPVDFRKEKATQIETSPKGLRAYFAKSDAAATFAFIADSIAAKIEVPIDKIASIKDLPSTAGQILKKIGISPDDADLFDSPELALRKCRYSIERAGLLTFLVDVPQDDYRGLFVPINKSWGLSLVNKRTFKAKARIFTLFHEFGHFLTSKPGASDPFLLRNEIEISCNKFASHCLAPPIYFDELAKGAFARYGDLNDQVRFISNRSLLSMGATAYRLREDDLISKNQFNEWFSINKIPTDYGAEDIPGEDEAGGDGGNYAYNVISDFGYLPLLFLKDALDDGKIDETDIGRLTNARGSTQEKMFDTLNKRVEGFDI